MSEDVVAELGRWADDIRRSSGPSVDAAMLERARDEIVALRASLEHHDRLVIKAVAVATPVIRAEALEEAAKRALDLDEPIVAAAIRALKQWPPN